MSTVDQGMSQRLGLLLSVFSLTCATLAVLHGWAWLPWLYADGLVGANHRTELLFVSTLLFGTDVALLASAAVAVRRRRYHTVHKGAVVLVSGATVAVVEFASIAASVHLPQP